MRGTGITLLPENNNKIKQACLYKSAFYKHITKKPKKGERF